MGQDRARGCDDGVGEGWRFLSQPFRVISRQANRDLSLTCLVSGLDLARGGSVWLDFASGTGGLSPRRRGLQERFVLVFMGVRADSPRRGFADLENRQT